MWGEIQNRINRSVSKMRNAILGAISSVIKENNEVFIKITDEEEIRDVRIIAPYGIHSIPAVGLFGEVIFNNTGKKSYLVGVEDRDKKPVQIDIGEILIYNKIGKNYIHLKNDGTIIIKGTRIDLNPPD